MKKPWLFLVTFIFLDQISKWWATQQGWVTWNKGISFGIGENVDGVIVTGSLIIVLGLVSWMLWRANSLWSAPGSLILAGASSNLIDRLVFGAVRDWLPVPVLGVSNNVADWLITIGVILYLFLLLTPRRSH